MTAPSPLAVTALALVEDGATAAAIEARVGRLGATLAPGIAAGLLDELAGLGLVRVARGTGTTRRYVLTSIGGQLVERGLLGRAAQPLEELERLRTELLSTIAHELRTPLTVIRTSTGLLIDPASDPTPEQRQAMLETIERNADRMHRLIGDILELARFRSGAVRLQSRLFDATELASAVVATVEPLATEREQHLELRAPKGGGPKVFGDRRRLEQALLNLVSNAQRFAPDGGNITVAVEGAASTISWSVTDDGPGIARDDRARLFERFFVGRNDRNDAREGTGLGLPTALAIAQAHGGTIDVRSRPGRGSRFTLTVPSAGPPEER